MNTAASRIQFARQREIRAALREQYRASAANEMVVARLRHEMSALPHTHALNEDRVCAWCFYGEDAYTMPLADVLAAAAESVAAGDEVLADVIARIEIGQREIAANDATALYVHYTRHGGPAKTCFSEGCREAFASSRKVAAK